MIGERDLRILLREMRPALDEAAYVITPVTPVVLATQRPTVLGLFHEAEGVTLIVTTAEAARLGLPTSPEWAHITLSVHSSLLAIGFMARIATTLSTAGISVNPVAGCYHDHLFVPWPTRQQAMTTLRQLAEASIGAA